MRHVIVAINSEILRMLGSRACQRLGLQRHLVQSGREALEVARTLTPSVVILDAQMPDVDGYEVCRQLKSDPGFSGCRVALVLSGIMSREVLDRLAASRCDLAMMVPSSTEEFFTHLADLVDAPRRHHRRIDAEFTAEVSVGEERWAGQAMDLSLGGARLQLDHPLGLVQQVVTRLRDAASGADIVAPARVAWRAPDGRSVGLEFQGLPPETQALLEARVLFDVVAEDDLLRVYLAGDFTESTEFVGLATRLRGRVDFDAGGVRYINSQGSRRWTAFVGRLDHLGEYTFTRCSVAFATQASLLPNFLGRGRVISFMAPYHCDDCERDETRLLQAATLVRDARGWVVPTFPCPGCGGVLVLDEIPARYFGFVPPG